MKIQVTLVSTEGYKPISTIVEVQEEHYSVAREIAKVKGVIKIMAQRSMSYTELRKYGYTTIKMRKVEEEKV